MSKGIFYHYFTPITEDTAEKALQQIGAGFTVEKRDLFVANEENSNYLEAPRAVGYSAVVRTDTEDFLGVVSSKYGIVQYNAAVGLTESLVQSGQAKYTSGFVYGRGRRLYLVMGDEASVELEGGIRVKNFFTLLSSHDGSSAFEIMPTFVREDTGTVLTFDSSGKIWTKHSRHVEYRLESLNAKVSKIKTFFKEFSEMVSDFATIKLGAQDVELFLRSLIPGESVRSQNIRHRVAAIYHGGVQAAYASCNGTLLGCYLAFCEYCDSDKTVRMSKKIDLKSSNVNAALSGEGAKQKAVAFANAILLAKKLGVR